MKNFCVKKRRYSPLVWLRAAPCKYKRLFPYIPNILPLTKIPFIDHLDHQNSNLPLHNYEIKDAIKYRVHFY